MWRRFLMIGTVFILTITLLSVSTGATCVQGDLLGTWNGEVWYPGATESENWSQFTMSIDSYGNIQTGSMTYPSGASSAITGGQLIMDAECNVQGTIEIATEIVQISYGGIATDNLGNRVLVLGVTE